jgi:hypothetical protein
VNSLFDLIHITALVIGYWVLISIAFLAFLLLLGELKIRKAKHIKTAQLAALEKKRREQDRLRAAKEQSAANSEFFEKIQEFHDGVDGSSSTN